MKRKRLRPQQDGYQVARRVAEHLVQSHGMAFAGIAVVDEAGHLHLVSAVDMHRQTPRERETCHALSIASRRGGRPPDGRGAPDSEGA